MIEKQLKVRKNSGYLLTDYYQRRYFSGIDVAEGYLVIDKEKTYFSDSRYTEEVENLVKGSEVVSKNFDSVKDVLKFLKERGVKSLYVDYDKTNLTLYKEIKSYKFTIRDGKKQIEKAIALKTKEEIGYIKKACEITQKAYYTAISKVREGMTEKELRDILENEFISLGADGVAFETIVAFGSGSSVPHHVTSDKRLEQGDVILIDCGAKVNGYSADLTRTAVFRTAFKEFIDDYNLVLTANKIAIENIRAGMEVKEADAFARRVFQSENKGEYFLHSLGHGLGLEIHEYPFMSPKRQGKLENGNVFTIEPGLYFSGRYGIRIEDTVIMKNGKVQRLYTDDKELLIL